MGWRKTGETRTKVVEIPELFCDMCGATMPDGHYPQYELRITECEYRDDGDEPINLDICSTACLGVKAAELHRPR